MLRSGVEYADNGFSRVFVSGDIPYNFMYVDYSGEAFAYLVSLDFVNCDEMATGKDYKRFEANGDDIKTVVFGQDDVYVYDSMGRLFYAKGYEYGKDIYYGTIDGKDSGIKITNIKKEYLPDSEEVKIIISIESDEDVKKVIISDGTKEIEAVDIGDGKYQVIVDENGDYKIEAEDVSGNKDSENITVTEIGSSTNITVTAKVTNGTYDEATGAYKVHGTTVYVEVQSNTAKYMNIDKVDTSPSSWLPYSNEFEKTYTNEGEKEIYIWVKDSHGNVTHCGLKVIIVLDEIDRPTPPTENVSGEIEFTVTPNNDTYAKSKNLRISFTEGRQKDGYTSMYRVKNITGWGRWTVSYEKDVDIAITRDGTLVEAKIVYESAYKQVDVANGSITVEKIDVTPPKITSLYTSSNKIMGTASDNESGLHAKPYLITTQELNFKYVTDIDGSFDWQENCELAIVNSAKYYLYVRDAVNNVAYASINVSAKDLVPPEIKSISTTAIADYAVIKTVAEDNIGIVEYGLTKDNSTTPPESWVTVEEQQSITIEHNNITSEGVYTVWVRDKEGNTASGSITVKLNKSPELDANLPQDLYIKEESTGLFEVKISVPGYPDVYEYQWEVSKDNGVTWTNISGATSYVYSFKANYDDNNNLYRCKVTNARGTITSKEAKLEVVRITNTAPGAEIIEEKELVAGGIIINKGASSTNNKSLSLEIVAINATQMSISETSTKGTWQAYKENITYTLQDTTAGTKSINVWIRDAEGNEYSEKMTAQIEYTP